MKTAIVKAKYKDFLLIANLLDIDVPKQTKEIVIIK